MGQRSREETLYGLLRAAMIVCVGVGVGMEWLATPLESLSLGIYMALWAVLSTAAVFNLRGRLIMFCVQAADVGLLGWLALHNGGNMSAPAFLLLPQIAAMALFAGRAPGLFGAVGVMLFHWYLQHRFGRVSFYPVAFWVAYGCALLSLAYYALAAYNIKSLELRVAALHDRERYLERSLTALEHKHDKSLTVDELTGLNNFRYFRDRIDKEVKRGRRQKYIFSLCILTMDDLDVYEKKFGTAERDLALGRIARQVIKAMRDTDLIARFQSNGFAFLLPDTEPRRCVVPAVRLRDKITSLKFGPEGSFHFNISIGVAGFPSDADDVGGIIGMATSAVHRSAARGSNQITLASSLFRNMA